MNDLGESCFPSTKTLAKETGLSERAVVTHLQVAISSHWLEVSEHGYSGQGWRRHQYSISNPEDFQEDEGAERDSVAFELALSVLPKGTERPSKRAERGDTKALNVVQSSTSRSTPKNTSLSTPTEIEEDYEDMELPF